MTEFIPIKEAVANIQVDLGFDQERLTPVIRRWIYEAIMEIGIPQCIINTKKLRIKDLKIDKPKDFIGLSRIFLMKDATHNLQLNISSTTTVAENCVEPIYNKNINCCDVKYSSCCQDYEVGETLNTFYFSSNSEEFTHAVLVYYGAPVDEDNNPLVPWTAREAILAYATYKHLQRLRLKYASASAASRNNPVNLTDLQLAQNEWKVQRRTAESRLINVNVQKLKEVGHKLMYEVTNAYPPPLRSCYRNFFFKCN